MESDSAEINNQMMQLLLKQKNQDDKNMFEGFCRCWRSEVQVEITRLDKHMKTDEVIPRPREHIVQLETEHGKDRQD